MTDRDTMHGAAAVPRAEDFGRRLAEFAADLRTLRLECGNLPLREIARRAPRHRPLSAAAVSETLNGKRLPRLDFLMALVRTLLAHDQEGRPHPLDRDDPRLETWRARWRDLELLRTAQRPVSHRLGAPGRDLAPAVPTSTATPPDSYPVIVAPASPITHSSEADAPRFLFGDRSRGTRSLAFSPDGRFLATANDTAEVRLWDATTGECAGDPLTGHGDGVRSLAFSPDGRLLATTGRDRVVRLWDMRASAAVGKPFAGNGTLWTLAFSPDGSVLATGGRDRTVQLWDPTTQEPVGPPLPGHTGGVEAVQFSPDGRLLASGGAGGTVRLWRVDGGEPEGKPLIGHTSEIRALAFSPDNRLLASGDWDGMIRLWDFHTGAPVDEPLTGHLNAVRGLAFSPDGRLLVSVGMDRTIHSWDPVHRTPAAPPLTRYACSFRAVSFSPDGRYLAAGGDDRPVGLWAVSDLVRAASHID
ncbi:WD40 repeat domain-containing protein [Streptomyces werraensis]|uniref:WD40 repeat domain-containing protein n=1 Tax=Streptomyces werraensis TaxID=68284 RepID=UPI0037D7195A